jgi:hypothetical protein
MLEQSRAELAVGRGVDRFRVGEDSIVQAVEPALIIGEVTVNFTGH